MELYGRVEVQTVASTVIPELPKSAHSCGQHSQATASGNIMPFSKTCSVLGVHDVSQCDAASQYQTTGAVDNARATVHKKLDVCTS